MKKTIICLLISFLAIKVIAQKKNNAKEQTLLWKISGNGLKKDSYLFGTIHMLCAADAILSENLNKAISSSDELYLELDLDNLSEMFDGFSNMQMKSDTTLADLLSIEDYEKVKTYFEANSSLIPFSMLESFKPFITASTMTQQETLCEEIVSMEQMIMAKAEENGKKISGMETVKDQLEVFDKIPYRLQAALLVQYIDSLLLGKSSMQEYMDLMEAYKNQDLDKFEAITKKVEFGMNDFTDLILFNRNRKWVEKLKTLLPLKSMVIAVGAGHLPGENGLINLLKKSGYVLTPVDNRILLRKL
jgi:uncharacterized protein